MTTIANSITDGVHLIQVGGLSLLTLLPLVTYALAGFAYGRRHNWDFIQGLVGATAALTFTFNVAVVAWYVMKFYHGLTAPTIVVIALAAIWYFYVGVLTLRQIPAGQDVLRSLRDNAQSK